MLEHQAKTDLTFIIAKTRIMVAGLSLKLLVQLYFRNAAHLTSF